VEPSDIDQGGERRAQHERGGSDIQSKARGDRRPSDSP
jgi:hypothetical protein